MYVYHLYVLFVPITIINTILILFIVVLKYWKFNLLSVPNLMICYEYKFYNILITLFLNIVLSKSIKTIVELSASKIQQKHTEFSKLYISFIVRSSSEPKALQKVKSMSRQTF